MTEQEVERKRLQILEHSFTGKEIESLMNTNNRLSHELYMVNMECDGLKQANKTMYEKILQLREEIARLKGSDNVV